MSLPVEVPREVWIPRSAEWVVRQHREDGPCPRCRPDGCDSLTWARDRLRTYGLPEHGS